MGPGLVTTKQANGQKSRLGTIRVEAKNPEKARQIAANQQLTEPIQEVVAAGKEAAFAIKAIPPRYSAAAAFAPMPESTLRTALTPRPPPERVLRAATEDWPCQNVSLQASGPF